MKILIFNNLSFVNFRALAIAAIEMAEGNPPPFQFYKKESQKSGLTYPRQWSNDFTSFLSKCLSIDPEKRPSAKDLLNEGFI